MRTDLTHTTGYILLPLVQMVLNHPPSKRNRGIVLMTALFGHEPENSLDHVLIPDRAAVEMVRGIREHVSVLKKKLDEIHREVERGRRRRQSPNTQSSQNLFRVTLYWWRKRRDNPEISCWYNDRANKE